MLTPQEVSERAFPKASFGGYNMAQVDEFLDLLTGDYTALYNENAVLKNKMKVLVEKVEEYRSTEEAMRKALMTAQRMADDLVQEAEKKRDAILAEAEQRAQERIGAIRREAETEELRLEQARKATGEYVSKMRAIYQQGLDFLDGLSDLTPPPQPKADPVDQAAQDIDENVQRLVAQAMAEAAQQVQREEQQAKEGSDDKEDTTEFTPVQPQQAQQPKEPEPQQEKDDMSATRRIDFGKLQFGKEYEIK